MLTCDWLDVSCRGGATILQTADWLQQMPWNPFVHKGGSLCNQGSMDPLISKDQRILAVYHTMAKIVCVQSLTHNHIIHIAMIFDNA